MAVVLWTAAEIEMLRNDIIPPGRNESTARTKANKLGLNFCPKGKRNAPLNLPEEEKLKIVQHVKNHRNKTSAAITFGVSRNYVIEICKQYGVCVGKAPRDRIGEHVEYNGVNWSWKKGSWICTSSKVRATGKYNLAKVLWEKYYGEYPGPKFDIRYKDGDRYNLKKSNLVKVTKAEAQKERLKDPLYKAMAYANGCYGLLQNRIAEELDPTRKAARCAKAADTCRINCPDRGMKAWHTRHKRAKERGYYFTDEARKNMSIAHMGKPSNNKGKKLKNARN